MAGYYGQGGGGTTTFNEYVIFGERLGPSSYDTTNKFQIDLSATFSSVKYFRLIHRIGQPRTNLNYYRCEYTLDSPSAGIVKVKFLKHQFTQSNSFNGVTGQPAGVSINASSPVASSSESSHTHDASHDHAAQASAAMTAGGAGVDTDALAPAIDTHTHSVNYPNLSVTTGAGSSHSHDDSTIYQHQHALTFTNTNVSIVEIANTTDLSATLFDFVAVGVRA